MLVLKIGPPCSGKGALGKAIAHLHGKTTTVVTMRDLILEEKKRNSEFMRVSTEFQAAGNLLPSLYIKQILKRLASTTCNAPVLFLDGAPRNADQIIMLKHLFNQREICIFESLATDEHLLSVFKQTLEATDRTGREDAKDSVHNERVQIYRHNLPAIHAACKTVGWYRYHTQAAATLKAKVRRFEDIANRKPVKPGSFENLEEILGLPKLNLAAA